MPGRLNYSHEDYFNLFVIYGECNKVISRTSFTFATRYPEKQKPSPSAVKRIIKNCKEFGSVKAKVDRKKPVVNNENSEIAILGYFAAHQELK